MNCELNVKRQIQDLEKRLDAQSSKVKEFTENRNKIEDSVFSAFCAQLGVPNIRAYEEKEFVQQQERDRRRKDFENQIMALQSSREYELSRDTQRPVRELEEALKKLDKVHSRPLAPLPTAHFSSI